MTVALKLKTIIRRLWSERHTHSAVDGKYKRAVVALVWWYGVHMLRPALSSLVH